jgi:hypothetical protein
MPRSVGPTTLRKNIVRESHPYSIRHKTHLFIQRLAELDERTVGSYLDVLIESVAKEKLSAEAFEQIVREGEAIEQNRRREAEEHAPELLKKRETRKQQTRPEAE